MTSRKEIALGRIRILFDLAEKEAKRGNLERAQKYVVLARKISMKIQEPIPRDLKRQFCRNCSSILIPALTSSIRLDSHTKTMVIKCFACNNIKRYPYKKYGRNRKKSGETFTGTQE
jgi:ribonuclease P protein subunit RPR2